MVSAGHAIIPFCEEIYEAIEGHWHGRYAQAASKLLATLVGMAQGQCESISHRLGAIAFLWMRERSGIEKSAEKLFLMLKAIVEYCPTCLGLIIDGAVFLLDTPGTSGVLQMQGLDTLEFIIKNKKHEIVQHRFVTERC
jgi:hypothetical protein